MTTAHNIDLPTVLAERLTTAHPDVLRELLATFIHTLMGAEADALCGASYGERSTERTSSRNGYRHRQFDTRAGTLNLAIPKLRQGSYFPDWLLERRKRAERALTTVVATCYLLGVSTRRMDKLVETLGITSLSKSQVSVMAKELDTAVEAFRTRPLDAGPYTFVAADALVLKVREGGRVVNVHALIAVGVNAEGYREILGIDVTTAEDGAGWLTFWRSLTARGLSGVKLVTSDAHAGLVAAIGATLPGATWQRCRTHYTTNLMAITPKASWPWVRTLLHSVFDQPDAESVAAQYDRIIDALADKLPKVADHLEAARPDLLAFTAFPKQIWRQIWPARHRRIAARHDFLLASRRRPPHAASSPSDPEDRAGARRNLCNAPPRISVCRANSAARCPRQPWPDQLQRHSDTSHRLCSGYICRLVH